VLREAFVAAQNYQAKKANAEADGKTFDGRDLKLEALAMVLDREIPWRQHSHRADDIATAIRVSEEFGYELVIDHGTEAHLIADVLAEKGIPVLIGPLLTSRSKVEVRNRSTANPGRLARAGVEISIITDHPVIPINFLVHQATFAVKAGLDRETALRSITINPAKVLGLDDRIGSLEVGKLGDLAIWSGDPLDVMQRALRVFIAGAEVYTWEPEDPAA
jgi:imidazolonepropionase-like amidohydrolase